MTVEEMCCRWAEQKYGYDKVVAVDFDFRDDGDYSELTPGEGPYMQVTITWQGKGDQRYRKVDMAYDAALIREILAFALEGKR